jgi:hypothetical protein
MSAMLAVNQKQDRFRSHPQDSWVDLRFERQGEDQLLHCAKCESSLVMGEKLPQLGVGLLPIRGEYGALKRSYSQSSYT